MRFAVAAVVLVAACAEHDLGATCHLLRDDNTEASSKSAHDVVQSGSGECEQFVCASFAGGAAGCTRPCDVEGDVCEGGWTCRRALLGPELMNELRARTEGKDEDRNGVDDFQQVSAGLSDGLFCAPDAS